MSSLDYLTQFKKNIKVLLIYYVSNRYVYIKRFYLNWNATHGAGSLLQLRSRTNRHNVPKNISQIHILLPKLYANQHDIIYLRLYQKPLVIHTHVKTILKSDTKLSLFLNIFAKMKQ